jgi:ABC-type transport system involved in multi-copper enzyme maturation permease subunit
VNQTTPSLVAAAWRVFDLSLGQMLWSRRTIFTALVAGAPVLLALLLRIATSVADMPFRLPGSALSGGTVFGVMFWLFYVRFTVPVLAVFHGTSLVADEVENRTITYLFTRPIRRGAVIAGKYLAYFVCTTLIVLPAVVVLFFLTVPLRGGSIAEAFPQLAADLAILALALAAYGALFALVGALFRRSLVMGLVFVFAWEPAALFFPGYLKRFTLMAYVQGLVPHAMPPASPLGLLRAAIGDGPAAPACLAVLFGILAGSLLLAVWTVERREYVLEQ